MQNKTAIQIFQESLTSYASSVAGFNKIEVVRSASVLEQERNAAARAAVIEFLQSKGTNEVEKISNTVEPTLTNALQTKLLDPIKNRNNDELNTLNAKRINELKKAGALLLTSFLTVVAICSFSIYRAVKKPTSVINFSSATSVLSNPAINAFGSVLGAYGILKFGVMPYAIKSKNSYNKTLNTTFSEDVIKNVLETAYNETEFAKAAAGQSK